MGRVPTGHRKYEIQHMWQRHHEIVRLSLLGHSPGTVATILGVTPQTISNVLNSQIVKDKMAILRAEVDASSVDVAKAIKDLAPRCIEAIANLVIEEGTTGSVRLGAAKDILDRAGHAAPKVIRAEHLHGVFNSVDLDQIKHNARQLAIESGAIEVEVVEGSNE